MHLTSLRHIGLMGTLGDVVRLMMERRGLTGNRLAADIGISPTSVSKIVTGASQPKQVTFSRLMKRLCTSPAEEQMLIRAFTGSVESLPEETPIDDERNRKEERERCERFLEVKTLAIAFKRSVARELDRAGVSYKADYCQGICSTDFLIERDGKRIALECKFNVQRDFEKAITIAGILKERLTCDDVFIVVPFYDEVVSGEPLADSFIHLKPLQELQKSLT